LALVLPADVWLLSAVGTSSPAVALTDGTEIPARDGVAGPALELVGCGAGHGAVASFVAALEDIDGVTRVGVATSKRPDLSTAESSSGDPGQGGDCRTRDFIAQFEIVVAFDMAPVAGAVPAPAPSGATPTSQDSSGVGEVQAQDAATMRSTETQTEKARNAVQTLTP
jgi:hypothetical protein